MSESDVASRESENAPTSDSPLATRDLVLLDAMPHAALVEFAAEYFFRQTSWIVWLHHATSIATLAVLIAAATGAGLRTFAWQFALAFVAFPPIIIPLHELLHALAYRLSGARDIRWSYILRYLAVYVLAHRFVASRGVFVFVALAPTVVINAMLIAAAIAWPSWSVFFLTSLLLHIAGTSGDWAMLNYYWLHRDRVIYTYDDADTGMSYFYAA